MQLENTPETYLFKIWPWIETNKFKLAWGGGAIVVIIGLFWFNSAQREQKEISAGQALTQLLTTDPRTVPGGLTADAFLKVAQDYKNTPAGQRALMQSAAMLYEAGKYDAAQTRFQDFLSQYPGSFFAAQAALGAASCQDVLGKTDLAAAAYQGIISTYPDVMAANLARFGLAQLDERQNKPSDARNLYEDILRAVPNTQLSSEAGMRVMELKSKLPSTPTATAPTAPSKLNP